MCDRLSQEEQRIVVSVERRKWGRLTTVITFLGDFDVNLKKVCTKAKKFAASGGTHKDNTVELQGDHRYRIKKFLTKLGFDGDNIEIESRIQQG